MEPMQLISDIGTTGFLATLVWRLIGTINARIDNLPCMNGKCTVTMENNNVR